ncbi:LysR family transcriptional regulator [Rugosimonospora africana]|uniref:LysR family transcriptional regulator n=1 Tax=Rugosimonospora africana TaxID=556532 RepID=A0A8J3QR09_9ACTN|nr:LysR family transcriptional regulator [Rugosimonospora africana]GIH13596.1 LysR family transcriptional regulator [Rugosimonospora africana]
MNDVEFRELRYFRAVAEELNFGRAAQRLGIAQPPLSKAIAGLERRLGVRLLERTTRRVELTAAGAVLLDESRRLMDAATAAVSRTRRAGAERPSLVVAVKPGIDADLLRRIIAGYPEDLPPVEVSVTGWGGPEAALRRGAADVALVHSPHDVTGLDSEPLVSEPRVVVLPATHRLAGRRRLRRADLTGEHTPQWTDAGPAEVAYWAGRDPASLAVTWPNGAGERGGPETCDGPAPDGPHVGDLSTLLEVVALGQAVAFVPASVSRYPRPDVAYVPVSDLSPMVLSVAWPQASRSRAVAAFVNAALAAQATGALLPGGESVENAVG